MRGYVSNKDSWPIAAAGFLLAAGAAKVAAGQGVEVGFYTIDDLTAPPKKVAAPDAMVERFKGVLKIANDTDGVLSPEEMKQAAFENGRRLVSNNLYKTLLGEFQIRENPNAKSLSAADVEKLYDREIASMQDTGRKAALQEQKKQVTDWINAGMPRPVAIDGLEANTIYEKPVNYVAVDGPEWNDLKTLDGQVKVLLGQDKTMFIAGDGKDKKDSYNVSQAVLGELQQRGAVIPAGISAGQYLDASARKPVENIEIVFDGMTQHYILEAALNGGDIKKEDVKPGMVVHLSPASALTYNASLEDENAPRVKPGHYRLGAKGVLIAQKGWYEMADTKDPKSFISPLEQRMWREALRLGERAQGVEPGRIKKTKEKEIRKEHDRKNKIMLNR
ncbi:hypothetical protein HYU13_01645 [Candidatus Woesearchaeota archaeon]|nr:hypothetical protein [Candidatus Woesearchaeota archaeon]